MTLEQGKPNSATADHFNAKSKGGKDDISNILAACAQCNSLKSNYNPVAFMRWYVGYLEKLRQEEQEDEVERNILPFPSPPEPRPAA